jgi:hypothetical protein
MKGINNYEGSTNEVVLISGPNCDNEQGYVYGEYKILWQDDIFILYGSEGNWPNLNKKEHVKIKKLYGPKIFDYFDNINSELTKIASFLLTHIPSEFEEDWVFCKTTPIKDRVKFIKLISDQDEKLKRLAQRIVRIKRQFLENYKNK